MPINLILKTFLFFSVISISIADMTKPAENKLDYLKEYIGTYDSAKIYTDNFISKKLKKLPKNELEHLKRNLSVRGPINFINGELVIAGNAPHKGGEENAILSINLHNHKVTIAIYSNKKITVYAEDNDYRHLPISIKDCIAVWKTNFRSYPPNELKMTSYK